MPRLLPAVLVLALAACAAGLVVVVPPYGEECFLESVDAGNKLIGSFEVLSGGARDIDVTVSGPAGDVRHSARRESDGHFVVMGLPDAPSLLRVCFANRISSRAEKSVAFTLHTGDELYRAIAKKSHVTQLEAEMAELTDAVAAVEDEQRYVHGRERADRDFNEAVNTRVVLFSVLELVTMLAVGLGQVWAMRSFFERRGRF